MLIQNVEEFTEYNNCCDNDVTMSREIRNTIRCLHKKDLKEYSTNKYYNFRDVKERNPLKLLGCIREQYSDDLLFKLSDICYTTYHEFDTVSDTSKYKIYEKIVDDLKKTKGSDELLLDPVYVILYEDGNGYETFVRLIIIYPKYPKKCENQQPRLQDFFSKYIFSVKHPDCAATVYQVNKDHKMFYDLIQKKVFATL